ncbi:MAG: hypothetical protein NT166_05915 [Candidatus Aminicenantes bacterium]|nr:hypothetical protein [Candidatus Aminicenantes bacterium]
MHCKNDKFPSAPEAVLEEKKQFIDLKWRKEKSVDISEMTDSAFLHITPGNLYVFGYSLKQSDRQLLKKYNTDLDLCFEKIFTTGEGPGDLGGGSYFFFFGDKLYVPDNTQRRINIFDKELNFIKFIKTSAAFLSPTFIKDGSFFIAYRAEEDDNRRVSFHLDLVSFPGLDIKRIHTIGPSVTYDHNKKFIVGAIPEFHYFYKNEKIYLINMMSYQIMMFDLSGKMLKQIRVDVEKKTVPSEKKMEWLNEQSRLKDRVTLTDIIQPAGWMAPLGKGFVVIRRHTYNTACEGLVEGDYFDYDLHLLGKVQFPCFYRIYYLLRANFPRSVAYENGYVYIINQDLKEVDEDINLEKWSVTE